MEKTFKIRLDAASQTFSAAHFITYDSNHCEPLHGHDFHCTVELEQPLNTGGYVVDFVPFSESLHEILKKLDHKTLLQGENPKFKFTMTEKEPEETPGTMDWLNRVGGWLSSVNEYKDPEKELTSDDYFQKMAQMVSASVNPAKESAPEEETEAVKADEISNGMAPMEVELEVRFGARRWVFPLEECAILPIFNTTAELLAAYVAEQLTQAPPLADGQWTRLTVEVEEAPGMKGVCEVLSSQ